jgi:hypothetical protein
MKVKTRLEKILLVIQRLILFVAEFRQRVIVSIVVSQLKDVHQSLRV